MRAPEVVETDRLRLRRPRMEDGTAIFAGYASDEEVTRYLGWPRHRRLEDTLAFLAFSDSEWARWPAGPYVMEERGSGRLVGGTGLAFASEREATTGYVLAKDAWGRGYATEALRAMMEVAQGVGVERLIALVHAEHRASIRVLEKCGFVAEARIEWEFPNLGGRAECLQYVI